jgi:predicted nucleic acid-binding protein
VSYLLDTNVLSEVRKPHGDSNVRRWFERVRSDELFLSVLVLGEVRQGVERLKRRDAAQAAVFERWLEGLGRYYRERVLPVDEAVVDVWGRINAADPLPVIDGLLASTALVHKLTLVTRNTRDVLRSGVAVLNPFEPPERSSEPSANSTEEPR